MRISASIGFLLLATCSIGGCRSVEQASADHPHSFASVRMQDVIFHSLALGGDTTYRVYLPAQIAAGAKLPVVHLLHGAQADYRTWSDYSVAGALAAKGLILVMPDGKLSYWVNQAEAPRERRGAARSRDASP